ncbi:uncharacterized protein H6S33_008472 [Morchella sextelata]|uniref:uncharacterized protein n=1 Tax=Morchella sextelata TaxID=1174677 RepID=UPI001D051F4E|nr:uncharacterized protein H6S33_008472 [Morchella sextelata]KAH0602822.1 hypothetical protein H6S33_008472 [Morchella sextelata]
MFTPNSPPPKPTPPAPPQNIQSSLAHAFSKFPKAPKAPPRRYHARATTTTTTSSHGPSLTTVLQKTAAATNVVRPKPRERVIKAFECASSFDDNPPPTHTTAANTSPKIKSQLTALHEAVFFDEGDFDDDQDLNFDDTIVLEEVEVETPAVHSASPASFRETPAVHSDSPASFRETPAAYSASPASFRVPTPPLPKSFLPPSLRRRSPTPVKREYSSIDEEEDAVIKIESSQPKPGSSAPFPWSSSPVEQFAPSVPVPIPMPRQPARGQVPARQQRQQQPPPQPQQTSKQMEVIDLREDDEPVVPKKRRLVPWAKDGEESVAAPPSHTARTRRTRTERAPAPREMPKPPWEMTASDFKRASRKNMEQQRRGLSTRAAKEEAVLGGGEKKKKKQKKITLSDEQNHVLDLVMESGKSVFFTGSAGTGKSVLMREVINHLKRKYNDKESEKVAVTASTGLAACNIGGVTLHSFAGIGLGKEPVADLVKKIKRNVKAKMRWLRTKVLVIDEISMVDGELFDKLEAIARTIRNNGRAFGGIQLVVTGDFFQLPPVPDYGKVAKFAFDANTWTTAIEHTIGLTQVFRQRDPEFAAILNEMRLGKLSDASIAVFRRLSRPLKYDDGIQATELFPTRQEVDAANNSKMRLLSGTERKFTAIDTGSITDIEHRTKLLSTCMAPQVICLKENSQVMLIKNIDDSLVNGSLGRVVGFMSEKTFDMAHDDPDSLTLENPARDQPLSTNTTADTWPLVEFALPDGTSRQLLVQPEVWKVELPSGEVQASRTQVPLILAWALSIHKAQGQTLERVKVDLGRVFEKGQAYVALSRATCQEGLEVLRFDARKVMAHEKVREFYKSLYSAVEAKTRRRSVDEDAEEAMNEAAWMGG